MSRRRRWAILLAILVVSAGVLAWIPVLNVDGDGLSALHESRIGTSPIAADSDGDGLDDDVELGLGTDPTDPDTDGDGLEDGAEVEDRIDPTKADTDGDGLDDGAEVREYGSDPRNDSPELTVEPASLNFVEADGGPATKTLVIRNGEDANAPVRIDSMAIVGRDAAAYAIIEGGEPTTLNPGESTEVVVRYEDPGGEGDNYATLRLLTESEEQPQVDVWLADTPTSVRFESRVVDNRTSVSMAIDEAQAGSTIALNVSQPSTREAAAGVDAVGIRVGQEGDLRLNVTSSTEPLPEMPTFEVGNNTSALGHFRVEHEFTPEEVESGWFRFRLAKARFEGNNTRPENVVLYRYVDGEWVELEETRIVGETETHYIFRAETPGFSDFTAGVKQPQFELTEANVDVDRIEAGQNVAVRVRITNTGEADGEFTAKLVLNGEVVDSKRVTIAVNGTRQITFERVLEEPGEYEIRINEEPVGEVVVEGTPVDEGGGAGGLDPLLLAGVGLLLLVILGAGVLLWRRRRGGEAEPEPAEPEPEPDEDEPASEEGDGVFRERDEGPFREPDAEAGSEPEDGGVRESDEDGGNVGGVDDGREGGEDAGDADEETSGEDQPTDDGPTDAE